jgi:hypothetical protein
MLLYCWLTLIVLAPISGCFLFVLLADNPTPMHAAAGAVVGMVVSLAAAVTFN